MYLTNEKIKQNVSNVREKYWFWFGFVLEHANNYKLNNKRFISIKYTNEKSAIMNVIHFEK